MPEREHLGPLDVKCPTCGAPPKQFCETRRGITHQARQDAVKEYELELRRLEQWNRACQT